MIRKTKGAQRNSEEFSAGEEGDMIGKRPAQPGSPRCRRARAPVTKYPRSFDDDVCFDKLETVLKYD
jgi:hypothetical protein